MLYNDKIEKLSLYQWSRENNSYSVSYSKGFLRLASYLTECDDRSSEWQRDRLRNCLHLLLFPLCEASLVRMQLYLFSSNSTYSLERLERNCRARGRFVTWIIEPIVITFRIEFPLCSIFLLSSPQNEKIIGPGFSLRSKSSVFRVYYVVSCSKCANYFFI